MSAAGFFSPLIALSLFSIVFAVGVGLSYFVMHLRRRERRSTAAPVDLPPPLPPRRVTSQESAVGLSGADATPVQLTTLDGIADLLASATSTIGTRVCPTCGRRFDESLAMCPHDGTPLKARDTGRWVENRDETKRPTCHSCGRRYDMDAEYCRYDGTKLTANPPLGGRLPVLHVCAECGDESLEEDCGCGCEEGDWKTIDPSDTRVISPSLPMMICPLCHSNGGFGAVLCPNDGALLRPLFNLNINVLAPTGRGPRRKICAECGTAHSGAATFCVRDGTRLDPLN